MQIHTFALILLLLAQTPALAQVCDAEPNKILARHAEGHTALWTLNNSVAYRMPLKTTNPLYRRYREWVHRKTRWDAQEIMRNQLRLGQKFAVRLRPGDPFLEEIRRNDRTGNQVLNGDLGRVQPITCLEGLAFIEFLRVVDLRRKPLEFGVSILKKGKTLVMIGDFYRTGTIMGAAGTSESAAAFRQRRRLLDQGYALVAHLHNHPFNFKNPYGDIGGSVLPSAPDLQLYQQLRPWQARITNGIESLVLKNY